jgi:hypothetical protein
MSVMKCEGESGNETLTGGRHSTGGLTWTRQRGGGGLRDHLGRPVSGWTYECVRTELPTAHNHLRTPACAHVHGHAFVGNDCACACVLASPSCNLLCGDQCTHDLVRIGPQEAGHVLCGRGALDGTVACGLSTTDAKPVSNCWTQIVDAHAHAEELANEDQADVALCYDPKLLGLTRERLFDYATGSGLQMKVYAPQFFEMASGEPVVPVERSLAMLYDTNEQVSGQVLLRDRPSAGTPLAGSAAIAGATGAANAVGSAASGGSLGGGRSVAPSTGRSLAQSRERRSTGGHAAGPNSGSGAQGASGAGRRADAQGTAAGGGVVGAPSGKRVGYGRALRDAHDAETLPHRWMSFEDEQLLRLHRRYGANWQLLAALLNGYVRLSNRIRTAIQCRERYTFLTASASPASGSSAGGSGRTESMSVGIAVGSRRARASSVSSHVSVDIARRDGPAGGVSSVGGPRHGPASGAKPAGDTRRLMMMLRLRTMANIAKSATIRRQDDKPGGFGNGASTEGLLRGPVQPPSGHPGVLPSDVINEIREKAAAAAPVGPSHAGLGAAGLGVGVAQALGAGMAVQPGVSAATGGSLSVSSSAGSVTPAVTAATSLRASNGGAVASAVGSHVTTIGGDSSSTTNGSGHGGGGVNGGGVVGSAVGAVNGTTGPVGGTGVTGASSLALAAVPTSGGAGGGGAQQAVCSCLVRGVLCSIVVMPVQVRPAVGGVRQVQVGAPAGTATAPRPIVGDQAQVGCASGGVGRLVFT